MALLVAAALFAFGMLSGYALARARAPRPPFFRSAYFPTPWHAVEREEAYYVADAKGSIVCALYWPGHPKEETTAAEIETWALAQAIARIGAAEDEPIDDNEEDDA